jgi:hypothetical protein
MERFTIVNEAPRKRSVSLYCNNAHSEAAGESFGARYRRRRSYDAANAPPYPTFLGGRPDLDRL